MVNVQLPDQPGGATNTGSGGTVPGYTMPDVWTHVGCAGVPENTTLCTFVPTG